MELMHPLVEGSMGLTHHPVEGLVEGSMGLTNHPVEGLAECSMGLIHHPAPEVNMEHVQDTHNLPLTRWVGCLYSPGEALPAVTSPLSPITAPSLNLQRLL
jgi:hypothetical protein